MKQLFYLSLVTFFLFSCSSDDSDKGSSSKFSGNFSAKMSGGFQNGIPVNVNITENDEVFKILITGKDVDPDIVLTGLLVSDIIRIDGCTNKCYQGDGNITNIGFVEISSGKRIITFGVYFPDDGDTESDAYFIEIEEN
tara:strand:+ start:5772 stop:6188 length:417 start_codon:yes stop_codon:yes gene_type:complete